MKQVSSAMGFVSRYVTDPDAATGARDILHALRPIERRVLELLARVPQREERRHRLAEETRESWEPARYERVEARALLRLQHELQQRKLLEP
jgi:hypothetical protein